MLKRLNMSSALVVALGLLSGCGNKGDLFLPDEAQLPEQIEAAGRLFEESLPTESEADDTVTTKKKAPVVEP